MLRRHHTQPIGLGKVPDEVQSPAHAGFSLLWQAAKNAKKRSKIKPSAEGVADGATSLVSDVTVNIPAHCRFYMADRILGQSMSRIRPKPASCCRWPHGAPTISHQSERKNHGCFPVKRDRLRACLRKKADIRTILRTLAARR